VKNTRHFGRAAENLYLTQAAVSARIRHLEELFGVSLFNRVRNNIQLTSEGERLVRHAETVLLAWSRARQEVALETRQVSQINLGARYGIWTDVMHARLLKLHTALPGVALGAENFPAETVIKMLMDRTLDIAISYDPPNVPELASTSIGTVSFVLASTLPRNQRKIESALNTNYVYVDWGTLFSRFHAKAYPNAPPPVLRTNISSTAREFIKGLRGSAYLPRSELAEPTTPKIYEIKGAAVFERNINAIYRANSDRIDLIKEVIEQLQGVKI
jgi:DNA-binding transcriptional LysR family regulator